jgi:hypothetical protein
MKLTSKRVSRTTLITVLLLAIVLCFCSNQPLQSQSLWAENGIKFENATTKAVNHSCEGNTTTTFNVVPLPGYEFTTINPLTEKIVNSQYFEEIENKANRFDLLPDLDEPFRIPSGVTLGSTNLGNVDNLKFEELNGASGFNKLIEDYTNHNKAVPNQKFTTIDEYHDVPFEDFWAGDYTLNGSPDLAFSDEWGQGMTVEEVSKFMTYRSTEFVGWIKHDSLWYRLLIETKEGDSCHIIQDGVFVADNHSPDLTPGLRWVKLGCGEYSPLQMALDEYDALQMDKMTDSYKEVSPLEQARLDALAINEYQRVQDSITNARLDEKYPLLFQGGLLMGQIAHDGRVQGEGFSSSLVAFHSIPRTPFFVKGQLFYNEWDGQDRWTAISAKEIIGTLGFGYGIRARNLTAAAFLNIGYQNTVQQETELFVNDGGRYRQASPAALLSISFLANYQIPKTPFAFSSTLDIGKLFTSGAGDSIVGKGSSKIANNTTTRNIVQAGFTWTF